MRATAGFFTGAWARAAFALAIGLIAVDAGFAQQTRPLTRIAFGSCSYQERPQPIWRAVLAYRPELFLFAGDTVYGDYRDGQPVAEEQLIDGLRHAYALAATQRGLMQVKTAIRHLATWDDHDFGKNDAGADFAGKDEAQKLFVRFWNIPPGDPRHWRPGVYHAESYGPPGQRLQVIMLDTRYFRSPLKPTGQRDAPYAPDDDPAKTMLGETQWAWLAERLREPAELRLVVSSIQVVAEGHGFERWGNLPRERQRLYDLIRDTGAGGVILLSGDRHIGAIYRETQGVPYPLTEITSSGINQVFPGNREPGPNRLGAVFGAPHFGTVDIDWWDGSVNLAIRGMNGEPVRRHSVALNELRAK